MRNIAYGLILASTLLGQESSAMDIYPDLSEVITQPNPVASLEGLKGSNSDHLWTLCQQVMNLDSFYKLAENKAVGVIKRNKIINYCEALKQERASAQVGSLTHKAKKFEALPEETLRERKQVGSLAEKAKQFETVPEETLKETKQVGSLVRKAKQFEAVPEEMPKETKQVGTISEEKKAAFNLSEEPQKVTLRPIQLQKKVDQRIEDTQKQLEEAQVAVHDNIQLMEKIEDPIIQEKIKEIKVRQIEVQENLKKAQENYDHLSMVLSYFKEDILGGQIHFKVFNPNEKERTTEEFIIDFNAALARENPNILSKRAKEDFEAAIKLLAETKELQASGEAELEAIKRDMMELNQ